MTRGTFVGACLVVGLAAAAGRAEAQSVRVAGFSPSANGFQFDNRFPSGPDWTIPVAGVNVPIGNASQGLCGGMAFAVRDYWQSGFHVPLSAVTPVNGSPLFNYIAGRLLNSLSPSAVARDYALQASPFDSDRQSTMVSEWPRIKADLDAGVLSPITLIRLRFNVDPFRLGENHQVLAYGYDLAAGGTLVTLHIYDPNHGDRDNITVTVNFAGTPTASQSSGELVFSFFRVDYAPKPPLPTQTWSNGFEGADADAWWIAGSGGIDGTTSNAHSGDDYGWVYAATGWNAVNTWVPLTPGHTCTMRAFVQTTADLLINVYMSMRSYPSNAILGEMHIPSFPGSAGYFRWDVDFTPDTSWGLFYTGLWGTGSATWLRVDDAIVVCQTW